MIPYCLISLVCSWSFMLKLSFLQSMNSTVMILLQSAESLREQNMMLNVRLNMDVRNLSMLMEEMKLVDIHHSQIIQNFTIVKGAEDLSLFSVE